MQNPKNVWNLWLQFSSLYPVLLACTFLLFFPAGFPNLDLGTKLTVKNATDAKTPANSASRRTESNERCPGPRFGQNPVKKSSNFIWLPEQDRVYVPLKSLYGSLDALCPLVKASVGPGAPARNFALEDQVEDVLLQNPEPMGWESNHQYLDRPQSP